MQQLRMLVLKGQWRALTSNLDHVRKELPGSVDVSFWNQALLAVRRQQYLELVSFDPATSDHPYDQLPSSNEALTRPAAALVAVLAEIQQLAPPHEYQELCSLLSLSSLVEHAHYRGWQRGAGRLSVWAALLPVLCLCLRAAPASLAGPPSQPQPHSSVLLSSAPTYQPSSLPTQPPPHAHTQQQQPQYEPRPLTAAKPPPSHAASSAAASSQENDAAANPHALPTHPAAASKHVPQPAMSASSAAATEATSTGQSEQQHGKPEAITVSAAVLAMSTPAAKVGAME
jgi:hypothetical protein